MIEMTGYDVRDFKRQLHTVSGRGKPATPVLDWFDDVKYPITVRNQARMAFETASIARHLQLDYVKEQEELLLKARKCAENAAHLDRIIRVNEQLVMDLRSDSSSAPSYSLGPFFPGDAIQFGVCIAAQTPFREIPSPETASLPRPVPPMSPVPDSPSSSDSTPAKVCVFKNFPPADDSSRESNEQSSPASFDGKSGEVEVTDKYFTVTGSGDEAHIRTIYPTAGFNKSVSFDLIVGESIIPSSQQSVIAGTKSAVPKKELSTTAPAKRVMYGGDLGELRLFDWAIQPYPEKIIVRGMLPDGMPEFDFQQVFGQLPPQIEISLELLTNRRMSFATRFIVDPTVDENIVQMRALDEFIDPPEPRSRKVLYVPWAVSHGVPTEWTKKAVRVRRYTAKSTEYPPSFNIDVAVTAAKNLRPSIQVLGAPFARKYVVSYAKFDEEDGAIAIRIGKQIEWIAYSKYTPDPPKPKTIPFRHSNRS